MKKILVVDNTIDPPHGSPEIRQWLESASKEAGAVSIDTVRAPEGRIPAAPSGYSGVVLSGSKTRIAESAPWIEQEMEFIRQLHDLKIPTLGICYGEQLIVKSLAGEKYTGAAKTPEHGWVELRLNSEGEKSELLQGLPKTFYSYQAHNDEVYALPGKFRLTASSADCGVQAYDVVDVPMWGLQFHPERGLEEGNQSLDRKLKEDPSFRVMNRDKSETLFSREVGRRIFVNFVKLVLAAK